MMMSGETGVGKTFLAELVHLSSSRADESFEVLNCFGLTPDAFDAFFTQDLTGTLLLDNVDALDVTLQGKLLSVIDSSQHYFNAAGARYAFTARLLATTTADLNHAVADNRFRSDLYHRLNVVPIELPSLSQRTEDIVVLAKAFALNAATEFELTPVSFSASAIKVMRNYPWSGNVRELQNVCQRLALLLPGAVITAESLPADIRDAATPRTLGALDLGMQEVQTIRLALNQAKGNKSRAAKILGVSRDTLNYRIKKYAI